MTNIKPKYEIGQEVYTIRNDSIWKAPINWVWEERAYTIEVSEENISIPRMEWQLYATKEDIIKDLP